MPYGAAYVVAGASAPHIRVSLRSWQLSLQALGDDSEVAILLVPSSSSLSPPGEAILELHHAGRDPPGWCGWPVCPLWVVALSRSQRNT